MHDKTGTVNAFLIIKSCRFFRDRNWLFSEFPELKSPYGPTVQIPEAERDLILETKRTGESFAGENSEFKVLEIGCGAGNTVFPLLNFNNRTELFVYCCDFSSTAVELVSKHPRFDSRRYENYLTNYFY